MSTSSTESNEKNDSEKKWWHPFVRPYLESIRKRDCGIQGIELAVECCIGAYFITKYGLRRPHIAFRNSMATLLLVPLIYWPICIAKEKNIPLSELVQKANEKS